VFFRAGAWPVGLLFCGLFVVYICELLVSIDRVAGERLLGLAHLVTGIWLMYLTVATTLDIASGFTLPGG
jgi:hypothetical protein